MNFPSSTRRIVTVDDEALAQRCARGRILLIDDQPELVQALTKLLHLVGFGCEGYPSSTPYQEG
uniref:hypothetical protein n=1 Tax=Acidovorax sp. TaxID=1872122 RepID=UPI00260292D8